MRILTLLLTLLLALLQESSPFVCSPAASQEISTEEICDIEEEAVIQTNRQEQKKAPLPSESLAAGSSIESVFTETCYPFHRSFERHWLTCRKLRL
jgi:hypothetical protein